MSSVDERIVQMQFNNKQFEDGVQTSIKSLDNLKKGLKLDDSAKSLSNLEKVGNSFSLNGIAEGVQNISNKFSALGIMGITVLQNLTNSVVNAGKRFVSSLTIDPIKTGLDEYETKMNAITTILTNTASKGTTLDDVNKALNELNQYADLTIYNFAEMTRNIGTFTAAGVDLKTSVTSIKGIANLAAGSGSSAIQASTAMYQLSQALAAGSVKLQDWNSVVNAGMGGELFQKALEKTAVELGHGRDMSVSFRESLEKGWITTQVLTKTLEKFANDKSLIIAATQVKTFTQLLDTMKESVQSGWAQSWENILGNKDEAARFFTSINDGFSSAAGASANARNETLLFWKANGGREAVIRGIANALIGLASVLSPIEEAFSNAFPAITGERLVEISKAFRDFTANFKIGDKTAENLKTTFGGLFAVIDIGIRIITTITGVLFSLVGAITPAGDGILGLTAWLGSLLIKLDDVLKKTDALSRVLMVIGNVLKIVVSAVAISIREIFSNGTSTSIEIIGKKVDAVTKDFKGFEVVTTGVKYVLSALLMTLGLVGMAFTNLGSLGANLISRLTSIGSIFTRTSDNFNVYAAGVEDASVKNVSFSNTLNDMGGSLKSTGSGVANIWTTMIGGLKTFWNFITPFRDAVVGIFTAIRNSLKNNFENVTIDSLLNLIQGGLFAALLASLRTFMNMFTKVLSSAAGVLDEVKNSLKAWQNQIKAKIILNIAIALGVLTAAIWVLSQINPNTLAVSLGALASMMVLLLTSLAVFSKVMDGKVFDGMTKLSIGLIGLSISVAILSSAMVKLSVLDWKGVIKGLTVITVLIAELVIASNLMSKNSAGMISSSISLLTLSSAITILSGAVIKLSVMEWGGIVKGLTVVTILIAELIAIVRLSQGVDFAGTATGILVLSVAMNIFAGAIAIFGHMNLSTLAVGLGTMAVILAEVTTAMKLMPPGLLGSSVGVLAIAVALNVMAGAIAIFGHMNVKTITQGLITVAATLGILVIAMNLMTGSIAGAAALAIVASSLNLLIIPLAALGLLSLAQLGMGLLAIAGAITVLGVASAILAPVAASMLAVSGSIALLGVGLALAGVGITSISVGLLALAGAGAAVISMIPMLATAISGSFIIMIKALWVSINDTAKNIGNLLRIVAKELKESAPLVIDTLVYVISLLLKAFVKLLPDFMKALYALLDATLKLIIDYTPKFIDAGIKILLDLLKAIEANIGEIVTLAIKIAVNFIAALADGIEKNTEPMISAIQRLVSVIISTWVKLFKATTGKFIEIGGQLISGLITGIQNELLNITKTLTTMTSLVTNTVKDAFGIHSPSRLFADIGKNLVDGLTNGVDNNSKNAVKASENMSNNVTKASSNVVKKSNAASKEAFDKSVEWIDERKYYNLLNLFEELAAWERVQKRYLEGTEERKEADKEVYRVQNEINKSIFDKSIAWIDERKYYNTLNLSEELAAWERFQARYLVGTEERIKADKEVYRVQNEINKSIFDNSVSWIDDRKNYNELSLTQELAAWKRVQKRYLEGTEERKEADKEVYRVQTELQKDAFDKAVNWIDDRKYYNNLGLYEELAVWKEVQGKYLAGTEERKKADKEVYRVQTEISKAYEEYSNNVLRVEQETADKRKQLEEDYYNKTKEINDKLKQDIASVNGDYLKAIDSRTQTLYSSYALFDKVVAQDPTKGSDLITNLKDQVAEFEDWQKNIKEISDKGIKDGLLKELQDMGPKSLSQIKALNELSQPELDNYVALWNTKYSDANTQAIGELETMRLETLAKISELNSQAAVELDTYRITWSTQMSALTTDSSNQLTALKNEWTTKIGTLRIETENEFVLLTNNIQTEIKKPDWVSVGANIVLGMTAGIKSKAIGLANEAAKTATLALQAAKSALGIHSPSKAFAEVGMYADEGFAVGLSKFAGVVTTSAKDVGNTAISALKDTISNMSDIVDGNIDVVPVIRPVIDLSNIKTGSQQINDMFSQRRGIDVSSINGKIPSVDPINKVETPINQNGSKSQGASIVFNQHNYSPKPLSRIDIYRQTKNQISTMKGLVGTA